MKISFFVPSLIVFALAAGIAQADSIYLSDSNGDIWSGDPTTGIFTDLGNAGAANSHRPVAIGDLSYSNGVLYGNEYAEQGEESYFYSIDPLSGSATLLGSTGSDMASIANGVNGVLYALGYLDILAVDPGTLAVTTLKSQAKLVGLEYDSQNNVLYSLSQNNNTLRLIGLDPTTLTTLQPVPNKLGITGVAALAYDPGNDTLYGFTGAGDELSIDVNTGEGHVLFNSVINTQNGNELLGAAFVAAPEPGTVALLGVGIGLLGLIQRRRG